MDEAANCSVEVTLDLRLYPTTEPWGISCDQQSLHSGFHLFGGSWCASYSPHGTTAQRGLSPRKRVNVTKKGAKTEQLGRLTSPPKSCSPIIFNDLTASFGTNEAVAVAGGQKLPQAPNKRMPTTVSRDRR